MADTQAEKEPLTLPELLARASADRGRFIFNASLRPVPVRWADLYVRALRRAAQLRASGAGPGALVALIGPNSPEWAEWAWGTWLSGSALVPLPAPMLVADRELFSSETNSLLNSIGCDLVVGKTSFLDILEGQERGRLDWLSEAPLVPAGPADVDPEELAAVLFTSGSTATPKGVRMSQRRAIEWARRNVVKRVGSEQPAMVTWFPFHHVAGLGALFEVLEPLDQHVLSTKQFLRDPSRWLRLISKTAASYAVSPSSSWAEVLRGAADDPSGIDLSNLRTAAFNAEMVDPDVLDRLYEIGQPLGLDPSAVAVHYASSEAGMISHTEPTGRVRVDFVDLEELAAEDLAVPARPGRPVKRVVSCGAPYQDVEICIGRPGGTLPERHVGDIWVRGPGVTDGYVNVSRQGRFDDRWFRAGDLGYLAGGELFVTGRADEIVVHFGHKYSPEDIEQAVLRGTGLLPGACVAFSPLHGQPGALVLVIEAGPRATGMRAEATGAVASAIGLVPSEVILVPPGNIPRTANGKLQRGRARSMHARGELHALSAAPH